MSTAICSHYFHLHLTIYSEFFSAVFAYQNCLSTVVCQNAGSILPANCKYLTDIIRTLTWKWIGVLFGPVFPLPIPISCPSKNAQGLSTCEMPLFTRNYGSWVGGAALDELHFSSRPRDRKCYSKLWQLSAAPRKWKWIYKKLTRHPTKYMGKAAGAC